MGVDTFVIGLSKKASFSLRKYKDNMLSNNTAGFELERITFKEE